MRCDRCNAQIEPGEEREHLGEVLCEDCYMDALSPPKGCDPWAVYTAKSFEAHSGPTTTLTPLQERILKILEETGGIEREELLKRLGGDLRPKYLEQELSVLRHTEKVRGEKRGGRVMVRLW
ncbi:MAG: hypothetical protein JRJ29_21990 [Deltaproteobacteria bacterium]|nr:hypothetical protein [Deltaproteobacteria bacterium]